MEQDKGAAEDFISYTAAPLFFINYTDVPYLRPRVYVCFLCAVTRLYRKRYYCAATARIDDSTFQAFSVCVFPHSVDTKFVSGHVALVQDLDTVFVIPCATYAQRAGDIDTSLCERGNA